MKLLLLKILLQRRARDEGFTLPMVIALGLVMILLGAVSITIANEENITAISQNSRSDALAIAEVGVARYRELLDRNRFLAVNDSSAWGTINQVCDKNISSLLPSGTPLAPTPKTLLDSQDLDNDGYTTDIIGTYSLVDYDYTNTPNTSVNGELDLTSDAANNGAIGRLKVKGTAQDGGEAQIQVDIPIRINPSDMTNLAPALWIGNSSPTLGSLAIGNGNIIIKDQAVTGTSGSDGCRGSTFTDTISTTLPIITDSRELPPITKIYNPTTDPAKLGDVDKARTVAAFGITAGNPINSSPGVTAGQRVFGQIGHKAYNPNILPNRFKTQDEDPQTSGPDLGERGDCDDIKLCRYYYDPQETTGLTYTDEDVITQGVAKTTLLLNQDLTINATTRDVLMGGGSTFANSDGFEIYVRDNDNNPATTNPNDIVINAASGKTITVRALIHAPQSTLTINGSGTVNIIGSVWVGNFVNSGGGTVTITPDDIQKSATASDKSYKFYSTTNSRIPRPLMDSPTNWKTEQIN